MTEIRFAPGLRPVLKHGSHNQKDHAGKTGQKDLPEGWSKRSPEDAMREFMNTAREDWAKDMPEEGLRMMAARATAGREHYNGPNGTSVKVENGSDIPAKNINQALNDLTTLQNIAPVANLQVEISDQPFDRYGLSESTKGFVIMGEEKINIRPQALTEGVNHASGTMMPVFQAEPQRYTLVHEYGHVLDKRSDATALEDYGQVLFRHQTGMSQYAGMGDPEGHQGREAFAEAWVGWIGTQGSPSPRIRPFVQFFADKYGWDKGGDGRAPSAGFAKMKTQVILTDTFTEEGAQWLTVVEPVEALLPPDAGIPILKHYRGQHDQSSHAGGGSTAREAWRREQENVDYISGRSIFPPEWTGAAPTVYLPRRSLSESISEAIDGVRRKRREMSEQREREFLNSLTPQQLEGLGVMNRRRAAAARERRRSERER